VNQIADQLADLILRVGPISFETFMEAALYDEGGFFASGGGAGRSGADFVTSVETGSLYGAMVAREIDRWWERLGRPDPFVVLDVGAGRGQLARDVLRADPACSPHLRYVLVERSAALRELHRDRLPWEPPEDVLGPRTPEPDEAAGAGPVVRNDHSTLVTSLADLPATPIIGVIIANELLDNLPFAIAQRSSAGWSEVRVGVGDTGFVECVVPADPQLVQLITRLVPGESVPPGARVPVLTAGARWLRDARRIVHRGGLVVIDYAASVAEVVARGQTGWLRTYRGHRRGSDPLDAPGTQDLTADVPLESLLAAAVNAGWVLEDDVESQAEWLVALGIDAIAASAERAWTERAAVGDLEALRMRSLVAEAATLTNRDGLGAHRVVRLAAHSHRTRHR
jgi:SAM-dependent MidA family methyltransferase